MHVSNYLRNCLQGINLVGASRVILFDLDWNPSHDTQSIFRAYRYGQMNRVVVYKLLAGVQEMKIYRVQFCKNALSKKVVDRNAINPQYSTKDMQVDQQEDELTSSASDEDEEDVELTCDDVSSRKDKILELMLAQPHTRRNIIRHWPHESLFTADDMKLSERDQRDVTFMH